MIGSSQAILAWNIGTPELIVLLIVALLIWGRRLPEIARSMGRSVSEFKKGLREAEQAKQDITDEILKAGEESKPGLNTTKRA